ncbi:hypothetical protein F5Y15DRAFT_358470 [Xylariaceae sp. FL0016]|nr:hypothetical protein F5Y15DRAFT_358470 [Xylariaceae sp. FL0016]
MIARPGRSSLRSHWRGALQKAMKTSISRLMPQPRCSWTASLFAIITDSLSGSRELGSPDNRYIANVRLLHTYLLALGNRDFARTDQVWPEPSRLAHRLRAHLNTVASTVGCVSDQRCTEPPMHLRVRRIKAHCINHHGQMTTRAHERLLWHHGTIAVIHAYPSGGGTN